MSLASGSRLGPYEIVAPLGVGGMGEVYRARDPRLDREVAIKVLPAERLTDSSHRRRFVQEARAASSLNHPNIVTIHEVEKDGDVDFIVMELVPGTSLDKLIPRGGMTLRETLRIAIPIADALSRAHEAKIVHRDLKPANVVVSDAGVPKILDFGLAKLLQREDVSDADTATERTATMLSQPGAISGTPAYMSPEQATGSAVDVRSDVFSFGSLLYEMVTGRRAFSGTSRQQTLQAVISDEPRPPSSMAPGVPAELEKLILRCLRKDPERRFQHISDVKVLLQDLREESDSRGPAALERSRRFAVRASALAGLMLVLTLGGWLAWQNSSRSPRRPMESLAVLPFYNESADPNMEYLGDGITESLIGSLSQLPNLRVMARSTVFRYKGRDIDPREVGRDLQVQAALTGRVLQRGDALVISVEMVDVRDGTHVWGRQYSRTPRDILAIQEEILKEVSENLQPQNVPLVFTRADGGRVRLQYTQNPEAYQAYLRGRYHWNVRTEDALRKGIVHFQQAIELDPSYALAYAGLADSYNLLGLYIYDGFAPKEAYPRARAAAVRALELDDTLAEPLASLAWVKFRFDWDWAGAEADFKRAIELNPRYATAYHWYSYYLSAMGRLDEARAAIRTAQALDPLSLIITTTEAQTSYYGRAYSEAIEQLEKVLALDANFVQGHRLLGELYLKESRFGEAIEQMQRAVELSARSPYHLGQLGRAYAAAGRKAEAQKILNELTEQSRQKYVSAAAVAMIHIGLGDRDAALAWFDKAQEERTSMPTELLVEPMFDDLRADPRFRERVRRMNFPPQSPTSNSQRSTSS